MEKQRREKVFRKTDGHCHICHKPMVLSNYANFPAKGAWEVDHSNPKSNGGSDHLNNLYAAHVSCNRSKRDASTRAARRNHGHTRAPYSKEAKQSMKSDNAVVGTIIGGTVGLLFGPLGMVIGAGIGAALGSDS
jgi:5-methylcytosine-specific restriction endonuclease McrA